MSVDPKTGANDVVPEGWRYHGTGICDTCDESETRLYERILPGVRAVRPPRLCVTCVRREDG